MGRKLRKVGTSGRIRAAFQAVWFSASLETSKLKADAAAASWRARRRSFDLPSSLLRIVRHRPDRLPRSSRQRAQRGRAAGEMDSRAMGRRRARLLRHARHRRSDRAWGLVRRHGCDVVCDAVQNFAYTYDLLGNPLSRSDANTSMSETFG